MDGKQWAEKIVQVQSGLLTATEAARQLGVSRKTYYKRENRALSGLMKGVQDRESGRPGTTVDEEKEALKRRIEDLEKEKLVLQQTLRIREILGQSEVREKQRKRPEEVPPSSEERKECGLSEQVIAGSEGQAGEASGIEYGLEKKRARQGE